MAVPQDSGSDLEGNSVLEFWGMKKKKKKKLGMTNKVNKNNLDATYKKDISISLICDANWSAVA